MTPHQTFPRWFANVCCRDPALNELSWVAECSMLPELLRSLHFRLVFLRLKQSVAYASGFMVTMSMSRPTSNTSFNQNSLNLDYSLRDQYLPFLLLINIMTTGLSWTQVVRVRISVFSNPSRYWFYWILNWVGSQ